MLLMWTNDLRRCDPADFGMILAVLPPFSHTVNLLMYVRLLIRMVSPCIYLYLPARRFNERWCAEGWHYPSIQQNALKKHKLPNYICLNAHQSLSRLLSCQGFQRQQCQQWSTVSYQFLFSICFPSAVVSLVWTVRTRWWLQSTRFIWDLWQGSGLYHQVDNQNNLIQLFGVQSQTDVEYSAGLCGQRGVSCLTKMNAYTSNS